MHLQDDPDGNIDHEGPPEFMPIPTLTPSHPPIELGRMQMYVSSTGSSSIASNV
eukprot:CAMPEP_0194368988 /NCGR_PEP_ID=MMETSP0174-20130528/17242_1 /TAXON_ID=216777 /ORGANISM="Proboscia alata, Strain PI-D3" /LENGTH=53 /DNA_ID=CAMNT_0039145653 /DNA_START=307 /DNA_END=468 /DNA_ORIENTATION=-